MPAAQPAVRAEDGRRQRPGTLPDAHVTQRRGEEPGISERCHGASKGLADVRHAAFEGDPDVRPFGACEV